MSRRFSFFEQQKTSSCLIRSAAREVAREKKGKAGSRELRPERTSSAITLCAWDARAGRGPRRDLLRLGAHLAREAREPLAAPVAARDISGIVAIHYVCFHFLARFPGFVRRLPFKTTSRRETRTAQAQGGPARRLHNAAAAHFFSARPKPWRLLLHFLLLLLLLLRHNSPLL